MIAFLFFLLFAGAAQADTLYTYTGTSFTDGKAGAVDGWLILPDSLTGTVSGITPIDFSFTAGGKTITEANAKDFFFSLTGDGTTLTNWTVDLRKGSWQIWSQFEGSQAESTDFIVYGNASSSEEGHPGVWTDPPLATPEPETWWFLALGAISLVPSLRRRRAS